MSETTLKNRPLPWLKLTVFFGLIVVVALGFYFRSVLTLDYLADQETALQQFRAANPEAVYAIAFLIYITVTGLSLPGAVVLTLAFGWFFGFWRGLILVSFASTTGATIAFLVSRYLFRETVQTRFGHQLARFNEALRKEGAFYLFTLRLIAAVPFWLVNLVMGPTPIRATTFWWVSQLGMLPGTAVYVYAGSSVADLRTLAAQGIRGILSWQLAVGLALLGIFPIVAKRLLARFRKGGE